MSDQLTSKVSPSAISLPGLGCGLMPSVAPAGPMTVLFGPEAARASLSAAQVAEAGLMMSGTSGRTGITSSASASLQSSLENKLRAKTASVGSTLYQLTWKPRATPSGRQICALRASARRTSVNDCSSEQSGWPTPTLQSKEWSEQAVSNWVTGKQIGTHGLDIGAAAVMAGWPTPNTPSGGRSVSTEKMDATGRTVDGKKHTASLEHAVKFADGPARLTITGEMLTGSIAGMESGGQLNPAHSRWLMGLPSVWDDCAVTAMQSLPKSRKPSLKHGCDVMIPIKIRAMNPSTMHFFDLWGWWNGATKIATWLGVVDIPTRRCATNPNLIMTGYAAK